MIYFNYDAHLKATLRFTVILMEMTCKKYAKYMSKYRLITAAAVQVTEWLFFSFRKIPRRATAVESYFSTVTVLAILLKQDPTKGVFMKTFQNFQNRYFLSNTLRAGSEFIDNSDSSCPLFLALLVCRDKKGKRVDQLRILWWKYSWLTMDWGSRNTLIYAYRRSWWEKEKFLYSFFILDSMTWIPFPKID